jgi:quinol monooxygenase YgiN
MLTLIVRAEAKPGKEEELRQHLESVVAAVDANEPDVVAYELHAADGEPGVFYFYERYPDEEAQRAHADTDHMKAALARFPELAVGATGHRMTWIAGVSR